MNYTSYPTVKETPSRKQRKARRRNVFTENKLLAAKLKKERRLARKKAREEAEEAADQVVAE